MTLKTLALAAVLIAAPATAQSLRPDQAAFRGLFKELVETNTALSAGSCTLAAERLAARMKAAGFAAADVQVLATPEHPKEGSLVAVLKGKDGGKNAMLLMGHLDVVEAKREDWTRDPFVLVEENGYFYGRGTFDDKAQAAIFTDVLIRMKQAGRTPRRTIKLALTCGEETTYAFNGADWLAKNRPDLIRAEFALNEGGGGRYDSAGKLQGQGVQVGEKTVQNFWLETSNPGGHSSVPRPDNAITDLSEALVKVNRHEFPVQFNDTTRTYFTTTAAMTPAPAGPAMARLLTNPADAEANAIVSQDPTHHSLLRTTCVATLIEAGHAENALAQRAKANVNCRMFPGTDPEALRADLAKVIGNPKVSISLKPPIRPRAVTPPMNETVLGPMRKLVAKHFPGAPMLATMSTGATDAIFIAPAGIPVYGAPGLIIDADGSGIHGLNERIKTESLWKGRDYLTELVETLAG